MALGRGAPRAFGIEGQQGMCVGAPQDWGKQRLHLRRTHTGFHVHWGPRAKKGLHKNLGHTYLGSWRVSWKSRAWLWLPVGAGHWRQWYQEYSSAWASLKAAILKKSGPTHQGWGVPGQTTNRVGTQPHPLANRLSKVLLGTHMPQITTGGKAPSTRGARISSTYQWARTSPSHWEACKITFINFPHKGADIRSKWGYSFLACKKETRQKAI